MQSSELFSDSDSPLQHIDEALTKWPPKNIFDTLKFGNMEIWIFRNRDLQSQLTSMKEEIERKNDEINNLQEQISNQNERY
jgi:predicted  nucleic acid-binding Zn-ribbon protein